MQVNIGSPKCKGVIQVNSGGAGALGQAQQDFSLVADQCRRPKMREGSTRINQSQCETIRGRLNQHPRSQGGAWEGEGDVQTEKKGQTHTTGPAAVSGGISPMCDDMGWRDSPGPPAPRSQGGHGRERGGRTNRKKGADTHNRKGLVQQAGLDPRKVSSSRPD